jgi:hypothetical protein
MAAKQGISTFQDPTGIGKNSVTSWKVLVPAALAMTSVTASANWSTSTCFCSLLATLLSSFGATFKMGMVGENHTNIPDPV